MDILLLAALDEEAESFMPGLGEPLPGAPWPPVRRIETGRHTILLGTAGIGKVNVATAAACLHMRHGADMLATIGTAGKLSAIEGDCFYLTRAIQHDYGARKADTFVHYPPGAWPIGPAHADSYMALPDPGLKLPHAVIASGDAFIEDAAYAGHLVAALDADLVDMETAALAQYARTAGLPWLGIKATTDDANHASAGDFHSNLRAASRRAALAMTDLIALL